MKFRPNQQFTKLGTTRNFTILRPEGFPEGLQSMVFSYHYISGIVIRADAPSGKWRIDRHTIGKLFEAIPGLDGLYDRPEDAAKDLVAKLR